MIALLQRVRQAAVHVEGRERAAISTGLLLLIGVRRDDTVANAERLATRVLGYRLFGDEIGRMNRSVREVDGEILAVPQFTLAADTRRGRRAGFSTAAAPQQARELFDRFCEVLVEAGAGDGVIVRRGVFGADMQVSSVNDGPVTFWLEG